MSWRLVDEAVTGSAALLGLASRSAFSGVISGVFSVPSLCDQVRTRYAAWYFCSYYFIAVTILTAVLTAIAVEVYVKYVRQPTHEALLCLLLPSCSVPARSELRYASRWWRDTGAPLA